MSIKGFLEGYESGSTRRTYGSILGKYCKTLDADPECYFSSEREYGADVRSYVASFSVRPMKSVVTSMSVIRSFLCYGGVDLPESFWESVMDVPLRQAHPVSSRRIPTNVQVRRILSYGEPKAKALFLVLSSSGLKLDEALHVRIQDMSLEVTPPRLTVYDERSYHGHKRIAFISNEAAEAISLWLRERTEYIRSSAAKNNLNQVKKSPDDRRIFPFSSNVARSMWVRLLRKAGYDERDEMTKRYMFPVSSLRAFFEVRMRLSVPGDALDAFMGRRGALKCAFKKYGRQGMTGFYKLAEKDILVFETPTESEYVKRFERDMKRREARLQVVEELVASHDEFFDGVDMLAMQRLGQKFNEVALDGLEEDTSYHDEYAEYRKKKDSA